MSGTAIVTGASSGVGAATAVALARVGTLVVCASRRVDRLRSVRDEITRIGGRAVVVPFDVTDANDRARLVEEALRLTGRIDLLVNNAGWGQRGPVEVVPISAIRENFESNVFGPIALTQRVTPIMRAQQGGRIINVSSIAGRIARPYSSVYDATKHALEAFSDGLRLELLPFGIHVIVVQPGYVRTEFGSVAKERDVTEEAYEEHRSALSAQEARFRRTTVDPAQVAKVVVQAATAEWPHARYTVPAFACVALLLKRLLPQAWFERVAGLRMHRK